MANPMYGQNKDDNVLDAVASGLTRGHATMPLAADSVLTAADSGKVIFLDATGAAAEVDITLPAVTSKGWEARFILTASPASNDIDVVSAEGDNIKGIEFADADTAAATDSDWDKVTFSTNAVAGDFMTIVSDGTSWYAHIFTSADNATTQTD